MSKPFNQNQSEPSVLDRIMEGQEADMFAAFQPQKIVAQALEFLPEREREVLTHRFGLHGGERKTLEALGEVYRVTRERIRQIERQAIERLRENPKVDSIRRPALAVVKQTLGEHGGVMHEDHLLEEIERVVSHATGQRPAVVFIIEALLSPQVKPLARNLPVQSGWKLEHTELDFVLHVLEGLDEVFTTRREPMTFDEITAYINREERYHKFGDARTTNAILAALRLGQKIVSNVYGEWGPRDWASVRPRRMGDKAYMVLKRAEKPLHFRDIAEGINQAKFDHKSALAETIHNELIADKRFVLVGRGTYGLAERGYQSGTVADVAAAVLAERGPLMKAAIISEVLKVRLVKPETVYLALTDKQRFAKLADGRYTMAVAH